MEKHHGTLAANSFIKNNYKETPEFHKHNDTAMKHYRSYVKMASTSEEIESIDEITTTGNKAEEFVKKEGDSLTETGETLKVNKESLNRVATTVVDEVTKAALARIVVGLSGTNLKENKGNETTGHGVTTSQVGGGVGVVKS
jgi:hypothetical protein